MVRWVAVLGVVCAASVAAANAPPYDSQSIQFRGQEVVVGTSFGMIVSYNNGATWNWFCPSAVGYGGNYAPSYQITSVGIFATTFDGVKKMTDGCSFVATPLGMTFVSRLALAGSSVLQATAVDATDAKIYTSTDSGATFPTSANPGIGNDWWQSLVAAPSNTQREYLSGYRLVLRCSAGSGNAGATCQQNSECTNNGTCDPVKQFLLFSTNNGATSFSPLATTAFTTSQNSAIEVVAVDPSAPDRVYAMVTLTNGTTGTDLYRSENAGGSWTKILSTTDYRMSVVARANGQLVAAWQHGVAQVSMDHGDTWTPIGCNLHIACLAENSAGELWACTHNFVDGPTLPSDGAALMKTTDLVEWSPVLSFTDIAGPASCAAGTVEHDTCASQWASIQADLPHYGFTPNHCNMPPDGAIDGPADAAIQPADAGSIPTGNHGGGCCSTSGDAASGVLGAGVLALLVRRRRRATSSSAA